MPARIGRVRGSMRNDYTAGVICEKVARYAERIHHPDRLMQPLRRVGPKGSRAVRRDLVGRRARHRGRAVHRQGARSTAAETVWPYYYAGTMGLVQRDGINRLRHAMRYSRWFSTICVTLSDTGWIAGVGRQARRRPARGRRAFRPGRDLGRQSGEHPGQRHDPRHGAPRSAAPSWSWSIPTAPARPSRPTCISRVRPGTDGALACAVMHVLFKEGYRRLGLPAPLHRLRRTSWPRTWRRARRSGRRRSPACRSTRSSRFARLYGADQGAASSAAITASAASRNGAANMHAVTCLPAVTGAWQHKGGGALYGHTGIYPIDRTLIEGLDMVDPSIRELDQSRLGPILTGDADGAERRAAGDGAADPEHQPGDGLPRARARCTRASRARTCSSACTSSS